MKGSYKLAEDLLLCETSFLVVLDIWVTDVEEEASVATFTVDLKSLNFRQKKLIS